MTPGGDKDVAATRSNLFQSFLAVAGRPTPTVTYDPVETKTRIDCMSSQSGRSGKLEGPLGRWVGSLAGVTALGMYGYSSKFSFTDRLFSLGVPFVSPGVRLYEKNIVKHSQQVVREAATI